MLKERSLGDKYGIHSIRISTPIPDVKVNIYFVDKPYPTLIDAPPDGASNLDRLNEGLWPLGYSIQDIQRIIVTHPHFDHYGSAWTIAERSGAEVWVSLGGARWVEDYEKELRKGDMYRRRLLKKAGLAASDIEYVSALYRRGNPFAHSVRPSRYLCEGDIFELASLSCTVTEVPGHTPWCILVHDVSNVIAFTGDFLPHAIKSSPLVQWADVTLKNYKTLKSYIVSLKRARQMNLKVAFPGHGKIIQNPAERIDHFLNLIDERRTAVCRMLMQGRRTPLQIARELFPSLPRKDLFRAISDVMGHLELLEEDGLADREGSDPLYFRYAR